LASKVNTETPAGVQNEPGFDSENEMDSDAVNAVNNIGLRSSSTKKKCRTSEDESPTFFEKTIIAHMEKSDKAQEGFNSTLAGIGTIIERAFLPTNIHGTTKYQNNFNQKKNGELDILLQEYNEASSAKTAFENNPSQQKDLVVLYSLEYKLDEARKNLEDYWNKRGDYRLKTINEEEQDDEETNDDDAQEETDEDDDDK
jgi:hypothetical protein